MNHEERIDRGAGGENPQSLPEPRLQGSRKRLPALAVLLLASLLSLACGFPSRAMAQEESGGITLELLFDYDGTVRVGRDLSVRVEVCAGAEDVEGWVALKTSGYRQEGIYYSSSASFLGLSVEERESGRYYDNYVVEKPLSVKAGQTAEVRFELPFTSPAPYVRLSVEDGEGRELAAKEVELSLRERAGELSIGILSDRAEELSYLGDAHLEGYSHIGIHLATLAAGDVSPDVYGLDMLDLILVQDFPLDTLDEGQQEALKAWVRRGGTVVFGQMEPGGAAGAQGEAGGDVIGEDAGILQEDAGLAYEKRLYGDGAVYIAPYSFCGRGGQEQETAEELFATVFPEEFLQQVDSGGDYFRYEKYWSLVNRLNSIDSSNIPKPAVYGAVLLLYALLAGPVCYLVLRKLGRRKYLWGCVGGLSVLFCGIIFLMGSGTRFNAPFFHYVRVLKQEEGYEDEEIQFKVQSPSNAAYSVYLDKDYTVMPAVEAGDYYGDYEYPADFSRESTKVIWREEEKEIRMEESLAFTEKYFTAEKTRKLEGEGGVSGTVRYYDGGLSGVLRNDSGYHLEDAMLFFRNHMVYIGDFAAGEEKELSACAFYPYAPGYSYVLLRSCLGREEDYAEEITQEFLEQAWKETVLTGELMDGYDSEEEGCVLAGFVQDNLPAFTEDSAYQLYGMTLLRTHVDLKFTGRELGNKWVYDPFVTGTAQVEAGDYSSYDNTYYSREAIITYTLPQGLDSMQLMFSDEQYYEDDYYMPYHGTVELQNAATGEFEQLGNYQGNVGGASGQTGMRGEWIPWSQLKRYVHPDGTVTVRYERSGASSEKNEMLPVLRVKGRAANAED